MTHAPVNDAALEVAGIGPDLIRLSVGLESCDDLVDDVIHALDAARNAAVFMPLTAVAE
jgi:O-acetylhomoserine (thiol)-lyase